ncbi:hypothetical protein [Halomonas aquatica]|uniref:Repeat domain-containing protein n=1 Tax=Halomonas aquatica TaxID=3151123 RepID=A0ABV1NDM3_9GAMM
MAVLVALTWGSRTASAEAGSAERIVAARYTTPVERYGHFALGRPHEYASLTVTTSGGRQVTMSLPRQAVFEDLAPRLFTLAPEEAPMLLAIVSLREQGSRLAIISLGNEGLSVAAQSPPVGTPMRWLNPVGVADLDGDGRVEIAAVTTPHIGGRLRVYRLQGSELVEIASRKGFSNHAYRTPELALSAAVRLADGWRLVVPDARRRRLRIMALEEYRLVETGRCDLPSTVIGPLRVLGEGRVSVGLVTGERIVDLAACRAPPG